MNQRELLETQLDELKQQVRKIEEQQLKLNQEDVLPYLQKSAIAHIGSGGYTARIEILNDPKGIDKLYRMVDPSGSYHVRCKLSDKIVAAVDDGSATIYGESSRGKELIKALNDIGIKVSIDVEKARLNFEISKAKKSIEELESWMQDITSMKS